MRNLISQFNPNEQQRAVQFMIFQNPVRCGFPLILSFHDINGISVW